jgi:hypothetical protein
MQLQRYVTLQKLALQKSQNVGNSKIAARLINDKQMIV